MANCHAQAGAQYSLKEQASETIMATVFFADWSLRWIVYTQGACLKPEEYCSDSGCCLVELCMSVEWKKRQTEIQEEGNNVL